MNRGIIITTTPDSPWIKPLENKLKGTYKVITVTDTDGTGFEIAGIREGKEQFDEFIYLMDTIEIKDISFLDKLFEMEGHVFLSEKGYHYMGKFVSKDLPDLPQVNNKQDAIHWELRWMTKPYSVFEPSLPYISEVFEEKNGRKNMVLETPYMIKYKGTWQ